ncbi:MAG: SCO1664 family protein [Dehalococcoidia bacterium]|nr:SCO1664 family protein [Dehalococcoidia bacterium]
MMLDPDEVRSYDSSRVRLLERLLADMPVRTGWDPARPDIRDLLRDADITRCELIPTGSNYTYLLVLNHADAGQGLAVYKPRSGEAPLWDFPTGTLYLREFATCELSRLLGWDIVPPTVTREGPAGTGAVQVFIDAEIAENFFTLREGYADDFRRIALFDCLANNADRKGAHCLLDRGGHIWGIDHGLTFHPQWKLRTVIWDFAGDPLPPPLVADLERLRERLRSSPQDAAALDAAIDAEEREALDGRLAALLEHRRYPLPGSRHSVPWPVL